MTPIQSTVNNAIKTTEPKTKQRNAALKAIRWVFSTARGYGALSGLDCAEVSEISQATVFTGLDNEVLKTKFWGLQLKTVCVPVLLS